MLVISLFILLIYSSVINSIDTIKLKNKQLIRIGIIIILYSIYILKDLTINILYNNNIKDIYIFNDLYIYNKYNIYIILLILFVIICLLSINTTINIINTLLIIPQNNNNKLINNINGLIDNININYINIIIFNIIGIILLLTSNNLLGLFISIELQSYSLYILTGIIYKSHISGYNSLLYYLIGGLGSIIILLGISLLYNITSIININYINTFIYLYDYNNYNLLINEINYIYLGWLFIIFGLLIKIGVAPMYNWSILIYSNSNTIITSYISIIPKLSILSYILLLINNINLYLYNDNLYNNKILLLLSLFIILSLLIGSIGGLTQIKIKSILAYSGLLNLGYLLLTILINNINSILAYLIYFTQYSFNHICIFLLLIISIIYLNNNNINNNNNNNNINNNNNYQHLTYIYELSNIKNNIYLVIGLIIIIGSFIGIPPLLGFYGKYTILISSINNNNLLLAILLIICSIISSIYYLYFLNKVFINNNINNNNNNNIINNIKISNNLLTYIFSSLILIILLNFIQWNNILKGAYIISLIL